MSRGGARKVSKKRRKRLFPSLFDTAAGSESGQNHWSLRPRAAKAALSSFLTKGIINSCFLREALIYSII